MKRLVDLVKLNRLDHLIRLQATGNPEKLAERLCMSRSSLFELISYMRVEMCAPIYYNKAKNSYAYRYLPKFFLGFEQDRQQAIDTNSDTNKKSQNIDDVDAGIVLDEERNFNNLDLFDDNLCYTST
jgi:hypothetical protein